MYHVLTRTDIGFSRTYQLVIECSGTSSVLMGQPLCYIYVCVCVHYLSISYPSMWFYGSHSMHFMMFYAFGIRTIIVIIMFCFYVLTMFKYIWCGLFRFLQRAAGDLRWWFGFQDSKPPTQAASDGKLTWNPGMVTSKSGKKSMRLP